MMQPVARVNGSVLTEMDLLREMYAIFPYARVHNGFPKDMEKDIRRGAMDMIIFEELLYQEAKRRNLSVAPERLARAEANFRKQFPSTQAFKQHVKTELNGSTQAMREKIRRSLLIEQMLKSEVQVKSKVSLAEVKAYYDKNSDQFKHGETVAIQTISIIPPENGTPAIKDEARAKIRDILRLARAAKTSRDFGLLAEQLSDDDWRTKLGDRGTTDVSKLPPEVVKATRAMKPGQVSDVIQLGHAYVVFRLNAHTLAGKTTFAAAKAKLQSDMQKQRTMEIRAALNQRLRKDAQVDVL
jgi:parvulin-like peptidyl-prolyl isomerase